MRVQGKKKKRFGNSMRFKDITGRLKLVGIVVAIGLAFLETALALQAGKAWLAGPAAGGSAFGPFQLINNTIAGKALTSQFLSLELVREAATFLIFVGVAFVTGRDRLERWAAFLWSSGAYLVVGYLARFLLAGNAGFLSPSILVLAPQSLVMPGYLPAILGVIMVGVASFLYALSGSHRVGRLTL